MKRISALGGAVLGLAVLAACGGGGGSSSGAPPVPPGTPATSTPAPSGSSFSSSDAVAIPSAAPGAQTVPVPLSSDAGGASANAAIPATASIPTDATVASTFSTTADAGLPALSVSRQVRSKGVRDDNAGTTPIAYLRMIFSTDVTMPQAPAFTFTVPGTLNPSVAYWLAFYDPLRAAAGWQKGFEGPAVLSATTVNGHAATKLVFASNGQPISFAANQPYYFVVFTVSPTTATPTPVPTSVPTNAPPPQTKPAPVIALPPNVQFDSVSGTPVPVTFSEQGFTGSFTLHGDCTGIINTSGASPTWTLTPVGQGRCVIVALGDRGATAVVHVGVVTQFETPHPTASGSPSPTRTPEPSQTPRPSESPQPSHSPEPSESPNPTEPPHPSTTPKPSPTATPTEPPHATQPPQTEPPHPSPTAAPTEPPHPTATPTPTSRPSATPTPAPGSNEPTPTPTPTPGTGTHSHR